MQVSYRSKALVRRSFHAAGARRLRGGGGFTLVEIMVVLLILSLLIALAIPAVSRMQRKGRSAAIANDFRVFATAFSGYAQETGGWPKEVGAGKMPAGMADRLRKSNWLQKTPIGGQYNWEYNRKHGGKRILAAITISATKTAPLVVSEPQLLDLDRMIDDGDLYEGNLILGAGDIPVFVIEP